MGNEQQKLSEQLSTMLDYLDSDPDNISLISDIITLAIEEEHPDLASQLLERAINTEPLSEEHINALGLAAMRLKDFRLAAAQFSKLTDSDTIQPSVRFNLAWSRAMLKDYDGALEIMDEDTTATLPQAAMLEVQIVHQLGRFEDAAILAKKHMEIHPNHEGLLAAISVLAMDIDDEDLALSSALNAGNHPDALTTLGTLALGEDDSNKALELFDHALSINPHGPRTWIGKGLAQLAAGDTKNAAKNIDHGAEMFGTHLGSWIASGWAYFIMNDVKTSRQRFEHALKIDDTFAESHGSIAVIDVLGGEIEKAKLGIKTALRLDRECFSAALAQTLLLSSQGNSEAAQKIFDRAINTPIDGSDRTIAQSMVKMGMS